MIYRSFFRKRVTKVYLSIFIIFSILLSLLSISKERIIVKGNEAYDKSFIYFSTEKAVELNGSSNIKGYNKALKVNCQSDVTEVFVVNDTPIVSNDYEEKVECIIDKYMVQYAVMDSINIVQNNSLY